MKRLACDLHTGGRMNTLTLLGMLLVAGTDERAIRFQGALLDGTSDVTVLRQAEQRLNLQLDDLEARRPNFAIAAVLMGGGGALGLTTGLIAQSMAFSVTTTVLTYVAMAGVVAFAVGAVMLVVKLFQLARTELRIAEKERELEQIEGWLAQPRVEQPRQPLTAYQPMAL